MVAKKLTSVIASDGFRLQKNITEVARPERCIHEIIRLDEPVRNEEPEESTIREIADPRSSDAKPFEWKDNPELVEEIKDFLLTLASKKLKHRAIIKLTFQGYDSKEIINPELYNNSELTAEEIEAMKSIKAKYVSDIQSEIRDWLTKTGASGKPTPKSQERQKQFNEILKLYGLRVETTIRKATNRYSSAVPFLDIFSLYE